ncbi:MAG: hypothetical protein ACN4G0_13230, partial [Polyangiales bacterium]
MQTSAGPEYAFVPTAARRFEARHPRQSLRTRFSASSVELADRDGGQPLRMSLEQVNGRDAELGRVSHEGNRVSVERTGIEEWYVHGPMGLEQGYSIPEALPPLKDAPGVLRLELAIEGEYEPTQRGNTITWRSPTRTIETRELYAFDAGGRLLQASMRASRSSLTIDVNVEGAAYPIVIDPLWVEQQKLIAADAVGTGWFGYSVSISGNTAVIGMPHDGTDGLRAGSAHVFVWNGTTWASEQVLRPVGLAAGDEFGIAVSLDGDTAVVGAYGDDDNGDGSGSAYVFVRSGAVWTEQQKLAPAGGSSGDQFGLAVSVDADTVLVGAPYDDERGGDAGAAHVFVRSGTIWTEQQKLLGWNSVAGDTFGWSVGMDGDTAVVGATNDDDRGSGSGSVFVFLRSGSTWSAQQKLSASDGSDDDRFGHALVIQGDDLVVGAPFNDDDGADSGSAYVFVRSGATWTQQRKLLGSDSAADDQFGFSVDISGESAVVGAHRADVGAIDTGAAYVFVRSGAVWSEQQKLNSSNIPGFHFGTSVSIEGDALIGGAPKQYVPGIAYGYRRSGTLWSADEKIGPSVPGPTDQDFGYAVSISGDTAVVGAPRYDGWGTPDEGAAYVFVRTGTAWTEQQELRASDRANGDDFGGAVSVSGDTIVVGAFDDDDLGLSSGAAYVFVRSGTVWTEQQKLLASDGSANDRFGTAVSVSGDTALVGAYLDDDAGIDSGSAYVFVRSGSTWTEEQKLLAPDGAAGDYFAFSVSVQADTAAVGAFTDDDAGIDSGSAYVFTRSGAVWTVQRKLVPADGAERDGFGYVVSLSGNTLAVGAPSDGSLAPDAGSVYVFTRSAGVWTQEQELFASDASASQQFGAAVSIDTDTMLVGVPLDSDNGISAGAAYVLVRNGAAWSEVGKILAPDAEERDSFGWSVALFGETALIGAYEEDERGTGAGAAYAFILMLENGDPCSMDGQCLSDLCDPVDLICACVDASDCGVDEVCDTNEAPNACEKSGLCGNGLVEAGETCDDGRLVSGDGCSATCFIDNQGNGSDCSNGGNAACASGVCDTTETPDTCEPSGSCGNSLLEAGESCDDGNVTSGDGCSATCFIDNLPNGSNCTVNGAAACASGVCDASETPDACEPSNVCGNGLGETGEACDDGNVTSGDGCSATCFIDALPNGSDCTNGGDAACASGLCDTTETPDRCEAPDSCGNGVVEAGETCDDGNVTSGDGCSATCFPDNLPIGVDCSLHGAAACASGVCDMTSVPARCEPAGACGNGLLEFPEACDDGNTFGGDGCS